MIIIINNRLLQMMCVPSNFQQCISMFFHIVGNSEQNEVIEDSIFPGLNTKL